VAKADSQKLGNISNKLGLTHPRLAARKQQPAKGILQLFLSTGGNVMGVEQMSKQPISGAAGQDGAFSRAELQLAMGGRIDDAELLSLVLCRHYDSRNARRIARALIRRTGSLSRVFHCGFATLKKTVRIRDTAVLDILHTGKLLLALARTEISNRPLLNNHERVGIFCRTHLAGLDREEFHAIFLNKRYELLHHEQMQRGTIDHVTVYPRELMISAIRHDAAAVILVHNHPHGRAVPSAADRQITAELVQVGKMLGIEIIDHMIVAGDDVYSFRRNGHDLNQKRQGYRLPLIRKG
jgi:DNA repair protein RadC